MCSRECYKYLKAVRSRSSGLRKSTPCNIFSTIMFITKMCIGCVCWEEGKNALSGKPKNRQH